MPPGSGGTLSRPRIAFPASPHARHLDVALAAVQAARKTHRSARTVSPSALGKPADVAALPVTARLNATMAFFNGLTLVEPDALHARVGKFAQDVEGSAPRDAQDVGSRFPSLSQAGFKKFTSDNYKYAPPRLYAWTLERARIEVSSPTRNDPFSQRRTPSPDEQF